MKKIALIGILIFSLGKNCFAHHAMEYIEMESYSTARKGEFVFHLHYDYMVDDKNDPNLDHWEFTPGLSYGILDRLMFDFHTHFAKFGPGHLVVNLNDPKYSKYSQNGPSPFMEAFALCLQGRITEEKQLPVDVAVAFTYEQPFPRSEELLDGQKVYEGTLILSRSFGVHSNVCLNVSFGKDGDETIKSLALGIKTPISQDPHGIAAGVEFLVSDWKKLDESWSILPGIYASLAENIIFKTGIEFGKDANSMRANTTLMYGL
ncbi:MAG: hypothetical protein ACK4JE_00480 [Endomicrobiia bacterium]